MMEKHPQISDWLTFDVEEAQTLATSQTPLQQRRLIDTILRQVTNNQIKAREASKLLQICQAMLAGTYPFYSDAELLDKFGELLAFSSAGIAPEIKARTLAVAGLMLSRMRDNRSIVAARLKDAIINAAIGGPPVTKSILDAMQGMIAKAEANVNAALHRKPFAIDFSDFDVRRAANTVREDAEGDWYRDPWGWPEIDWLAASRPEKVLNRVRSHDHGWTAAVDVAKKNGEVRPGIIINPLDRLSFQCLVDELSVEAAGDLPPWVHGWRLDRSFRGRGVYASNHDEWKAFSHRLTENSRTFSHSAHLDIQSFFSSVDTSIILSQLGRRFRKTAVLDRLDAFFQTWQRQPNGLGVPQRSFASSVLIHIILRPLDTYLDRLMQGGSAGTFAVCRWMDDIWIYNNNESALRTCISEIEELLGPLRLSLNAEKTQIDPDKVVSPDVYDQDDEGDTLEQLLSNIEGAPSPMVSHQVSKLIQGKKFLWFDSYKPKDFLQISHRANQLARGFRASGNWKRFTQTYLTFARQRVSRENLSVAGWGEMFPNAPTPEAESVQKYFVSMLCDDSQRLLTPLAAQRVAAWRGLFKENVLSDVNALWKVAGSDDVFRLRGISFAALEAGSSKGGIVETFRETEDSLVAEFLADRNFSPPPLSSIFLSE
jgi:hypothetical protein